MKIRQKSKALYAMVIAGTISMILQSISLVYGEEINWFNMVGIALLLIYTAAAFIVLRNGYIRITESTFVVSHLFGSRKIALSEISGIFRKWGDYRIETRSGKELEISLDHVHKDDRAKLQEWIEKLDIQD